MRRYIEVCLSVQIATFHTIQLTNLFEHYFVISFTGEGHRIWNSQGKHVRFLGCK